MLVVVWEGDITRARGIDHCGLTRALSVLRHLYGLFRSEKGVAVSVRGSLEGVETKADHGAWFFSSSLEADVAWQLGGQASTKREREKD